MLFEIDGIPYEAKTEPDLRFLQPYGKVFKVFDTLVSGNLCFGVEGPYGRLFIKLAGADTLNFTGRPSDAIETLRNAVPLLQTQHPALARLYTHGPVLHGYAAVFEWLDAQPFVSSDRSDRTVRSRMQTLPLPSQLAMIDNIFSLHLALAEKGFIAVDFSARNVLLDLYSARSFVCDIDQYLPCPAVNRTGRMPGEADYLAPEEYIRGSTISEDSTVYKLGRLALSFFTEHDDPSPSSFMAPKPLYPVMQKAMDENRARRYRTVSDFVGAWRNALGSTWIR